MVWVQFVTVRYTVSDTDCVSFTDSPRRMTLLCEPPCIKKSLCSSLIKELHHVSWCTDVALVVYLKSIIYSHSVFSVSSPTSTFSAVLKKMFNGHSVDFDAQFLHLHFKILILLWVFLFVLLKNL